MAKKSFEDYKRSFPSDELLCEMFGVANYDELFEAHYDQAAKLIRQGHVLAIYPSDVSIAKAASRGELTSEIGPNGREIMGLNKELYRQNCNLFGQVRNSIESSLRTWAMSWIRNQHELPDWDGIVRPCYIFKNGDYGEVVKTHAERNLPEEPRLREKLRLEFAAAVATYELWTDTWWDYVVEEDNIYLKPKELTDELKAAMQQQYDKERAKHWLVSNNFYPGWKPDKSNDPPEDWKPATVTRLDDLLTDD